MNRLDSLVRLIRLDSISFEVAANRYSEDEESNVNGGQVVNLARGGSRFHMDEFDPTEYNIISNLKVGEISDPYEATDGKGRTVYRVIWLRNRTQPHVANLKDDYNIFKDKALEKKQTDMVNQWVENKIKSTYIRIADLYSSCHMSLEGWPNTMAQTNR